MRSKFGAGEETSTSKHYEGYGIQTNSYANFTLGMEWLQYYKHEFMASFVPFFIQPFVMEFYYVRPETGTTFSMGMRAYRNTKFMVAQVTLNEWMKTCQMSIYDATMTKNYFTNYVTNYCTYDSRWFVKYEDSYFTFDYVKKYWNTSSWYGKIYWFDQKFF